MCCGTIVKHLPQATNYKCLNCSTTHAFHQFQPDDNNHTELSFDFLQSTISTPETSKNLCSILYNSFASSTILNESFKRHSKNKLRFSSPNINYDDLSQFYDFIMKLNSIEPMFAILNGSIDSLKKINLNKITLNVIEIRWILIILLNPILSDASFLQVPLSSLKSPPLNSTPKFIKIGKMNIKESNLLQLHTLSYNILKRSIGILSNLSNLNNNFKIYLINWFARFDSFKFKYLIDLLNSYISLRLRKHLNINLNRSKSIPGPQDDKKKQQIIKLSQYGFDWQIETSLRLFRIIFNSNNVRPQTEKFKTVEFYNAMIDLNYINLNDDFESWNNLSSRSNSISTQEEVVPDINNIEEYVVSMASLIGTGSNFTRPAKKIKPNFTICQYPFLLSLNSKLSILRYESRKKMNKSAEQAFVTALDLKQQLCPVLKFKIRRDCIVNDTIDEISHLLLNNDNPNFNLNDEFKKKLKIEFIDEEGIDAGGLKKEWFSLLIESLFDLNYGFFINIQESGYYWFNFNLTDNYNNENDKIYYLIGILLGLAVYNSTILDLNFPRILYKKLLHDDSHKDEKEKQEDKKFKWSMEDFEQLYPIISSNLKKILSYDDKQFKEDDIELYFEITVESFGFKKTINLLPNGNNKKVNNDNKYLFVDLYINYYLEISCKRPFKLLKKGFLNSVGSNALKLFSAEEIELSICGSPEFFHSNNGNGNGNGKKGIDVDLLRAVTIYRGFKNEDRIVEWFWKIVEDMEVEMQRKLFIFMTGLGRVPALGISTMKFKITNMKTCETDRGRLPISHTCFNEICLWDYESMEELSAKLYFAVNESGGFALK